MKSIIVLEDDKDINNILTSCLKTEGYTVFSCFNGFQAMDIFANEKIDAIITDLVLPIMSGERFIKEIRKLSNVHILIVSAKGSLPEKLEGLRVGADDYLVKPFSPKEIIIKLQNYFKKINHQNEIISINQKELVFEMSKVQVIISGTIIDLTAIEYSITKYLLQRLNSVISRKQILTHIFHDEKFVTERTVDSHIKNLRKKMSQHTSRKYIRTVYGLGYSMVGQKDET